MGKVCVLLAEGFEEIEATVPIDMLRRVGLEVAVLGVTALDVCGVHGLRVQADGLLRDGIGPWRAVVLPGGPGAEVLRDNLDVQAFLRQLGGDSGCILGAICAAPIALAHAGLLQGRRATCYPGFEAQCRGAVLVETPVVRDGSIITSRGPGTAVPFGLALIEALCDRQSADKVAAQMLYPAPS